MCQIYTLALSNLSICSPNLCLWCSILTPTNSQVDAYNSVISNLLTVFVCWLFGTVQFGTQDRHKKIQMENKSLTWATSPLSALTQTMPFIIMVNSPKYQFQMVPVSTYMWQIDKTLRYVLSCISVAFLLISRNESDQNWPDIQWEKFAQHAVNIVWTTL